MGAAANEARTLCARSHMALVSQGYNKIHNALFGREST